MEKISLLLSILILSVFNTSLAQNDVSKWDFGISLGVNSLKLSNGDNANFNIFSESNSNINHEKKRISFQGYAIAKYNINRRWQILGNIGVLYAKGKAYRQSTEKVALFSLTETTKLDTIVQKYMMLDIPIYIRWQIIAKDNEKWNIKPFMDLGFSIKIPLSQETYFGQEVNTLHDPLFGGPINSTTHHSGELIVQKPFVYFSVGILVGKKSSLAFSLSGINSHAVGNEGIYFSSIIKSLKVSRFF